MYRGANSCSIILIFYFFLASFKKLYWKGIFDFLSMHYRNILLKIRTSLYWQHWRCQLSQLGAPFFLWRGVPPLLCYRQCWTGLSFPFPSATVVESSTFSCSLAQSLPAFTCTLPAACTRIITCVSVGISHWLSLFPRLLLSLLISFFN